LYFHVTLVGSLILSGFWAAVSERFHPRMMRHHATGITGAGTLGGLVAAPAAAWLGTSATSSVVMLPAMAVLHVLCGGCVALFGDARGGGDQVLPDVGEQPPRANGPHMLRVRLLRDLGLFMLVTSTGATLIDYLLKARARGVYGGETSLLQFFLFFQAATAAFTFVLQVGLTGRLLEKFGLAKTASALPLALGAGAIGAIVAPRLASIGIARGAETAVRSSAFRSASEILYNPVPAGHKRAGRTLIDIVADRLGDALGGAGAQLALAAGLPLRR
jgi:AAA family ATP:ADP antiporter